MDVGRALRLQSNALGPPPLSSCVIRKASATNTRARNEYGTRSATAKYAEHAEGEAERQLFFSAYSVYSAVGERGFRAWRERMKPYNQWVQATPGSALGEFVAAWPGAPDPGRSAAAQEYLCDLCDLCGRVARSYSPQRTHRSQRRPRTDSSGREMDRKQKCRTSRCSGRRESTSATLERSWPAATELLG